LWNQSVLCWMAPSALCALVVFRFLLVEMRGSTLALTMLWLAALLILSRFAISLAAPLPLPPLESRLLGLGVALGAGICLFMSLLFYARHAIYFSVEPPIEKSGWLAALLRRLRPRWPSLRTSSQAKATKRSTVSAVRRRRKTAARPSQSPAAQSEQDLIADETETGAGKQVVQAPRSTPPTGNKPSSQPLPQNPARRPDATSSNSVSGSTAAPMSRRERRMRQKELRAEQTQLRRSA